MSPIGRDRARSFAPDGRLWKRARSVFLGGAMAWLGAAEAFALDEIPEIAEIPATPIFVEYASGFDFSRGDYGLDRDSTLYYVPLGVTVDRGYWRFGVSLPLLYSDGVAANPLAAGPGAGRLEPDRVAGLGDVVTSVSRLFDPEIAALPWVELKGQVSWPTRTAEAIGTGDFAFTTQIDFFEEISLRGRDERTGRMRAPAWTPFATFGRNYYLVGSLRDRFFTTVGVALRVDDAWSFGAAWDWFEATNRDLDDAHQIVPFVSWRSSTHWSVGPYAVAGLSDGAPDFGVGLSLRYRP